MKTHRGEGNRDEGESAHFDRRLATEELCFRKVSKHLARLAARIGVPASDLKDVVAEAWLDWVKHRNGFAYPEVEQQLYCWLTKVTHSKAVDSLRRLDRHRCEPLPTGEEELIDDGEAKRAQRPSRKST